MPKKRPESTRARKNRLRRAREAKVSPVTYTGGSRSYAGVLPDSPLSSSNLDSVPPLPKRQRTPKSSPAEPLPLPQPTDQPDAPLAQSPIPGSSSSVAPSLFTVPLMEEGTPLDRRWQAVAIAIVRESQLKRPLSLSELDEIAKERGQGSGQLLAQYMNDVKCGRLLTMYRD